MLKYSQMKDIVWLLGIFVILLILILIGITEHKVYLWAPCTYAAGGTLGFLIEEIKDKL